MQKRSLFEWFTEVIGWLQIVASPLLAGLILGAITYFSVSGIVGVICAIAIACLGLIAGIIWANRIWRKKGTIRFMSEIMATPELDIEKEN